MSDGQCIYVSPISYCGFRSIDGKCLKCNPGILSANKLSCAYVSNCQMQDYYGNCFLCSEGYSFNGGGQCVSLPSNCARLYDNGTCAYCLSNNYQLANGSCVFTNCFQIYSDFTCVNCQFTAYKVNAAHQCIYVGGNCQYYDNNADLCAVCYDGYYFDGTSCVSCPTNCMICVGTLCKKCNNYYALNSIGNCVYVTTYCYSEQAIYNESGVYSCKCNLIPSLQQYRVEQL